MFYPFSTFLLQDFAAGLAFARSGGESVLPPALLWYAFGLFLFTCVISAVARREAGRPRVQRAVTVLLSGMCLFDAVWLLSFGSVRSRRTKRPMLLTHEIVPA